jgi:hypothetical protein
MAVGCGCAVEIRVRNRDTETFPCVLHHAGGDALSSYGLELKRRYFDLIGAPNRRFSFSKSGRARGLQIYRRPARRLPLRPIPKLSIVTWTSFRFPGSAELSLGALGFPLDLFRLPGPWQNIRKLRLLRDYLDRVDTDYVLFLDSHDTFVTSDLAGIVEAFRKLGCRMLFQADSHDWPPFEGTRDFYASNAEPGTPFIYLCSGVFMGEVPFVRRVVDRALVTPPLIAHDDQGVYKQIFPEFYPEAQLDYKCRLFQPLTDYQDRRRPGRFDPVSLRLELVFQPGPEAIPDSLARTPVKFFRFAPYWMARRWDAARDALASLRRSAEP